MLPTEPLRTVQNFALRWQWMRGVFMSGALAGLIFFLFAPELAVFFTNESVYTLSVIALVLVSFFGYGFLWYFDQFNPTNPDNPNEILEKKIREGWVYLLLLVVSPIFGLLTLLVMYQQI